MTKYFIISIAFVILTSCGGKQKEAEALAEKEFMGTKGNEGKKEEWLKCIIPKN